MALTNFIPTIWSETLWRELDKKYYAVGNCNRDFEGEIKNQGDTVKINGVSAVTISDYTKNNNFSGGPETLSDSTRSLVITQAKMFNFQIDDIDKAQQKPKVMQEAMSIAADGLANAADSYIYGMYGASGNTIGLDGSSNTMFKSQNNNVVAAAQITAATVVAKLLAIRKMLMENNVSADASVALEIPPAVWALIAEAMIDKKTNNDAITNRGYVGTFLGFDFYVSNNIAAVTETVSSASKSVYKCYARTKRAVTFAEQIKSVEAYRPELRFADAVKGLHLYGAKLIYPKECILVNWYL